MPFFKLFSFQKIPSYNNTDYAHNYAHNFNEIIIAIVKYSACAISNSARVKFIESVPTI